MLLIMRASIARMRCRYFQTTATINQRRADPTHAEKRLVLNGSRGYFDAARDAAGASMAWYRSMRRIGSVRR
jgi:hypothetical protein